MSIGLFQPSELVLNEYDNSLAAFRDIVICKRKQYPCLPVNNQSGWISQLVDKPYELMERDYSFFDFSPPVFCRHGLQTGLSSTHTPSGSVSGYFLLIAIMGCPQTEQNAIGFAQPPQGIFLYRLSLICWIHSCSPEQEGEFSLFSPLHSLEVRYDSPALKTRLTLP